MDNQELKMIKEDYEVKPGSDKIIQCELPKTDEKLSLSNDLRKEYTDVQNDLPTNNIKEEPSLTKCNNLQKQFNNDTASVKIEEDFNQINEEIFVESILTPNGKPLFKCLICNEAFLLRFYLNNHMKKIHDEIFVGSILTPNGKPLFKCLICNEAFLLRFYLKNHMKKIHVKKNTYECNKFSNE